MKVWWNGLLVSFVVEMVSDGLVDGDNMNNETEGRMVFLSESQKWMCYLTILLA